MNKENWGLMVHIDSMYFRGKEDGGCSEYIQFGKDDLVPFVTLVRSKKMCGEVTNFSFDVDNGAMNIWMHFDDKREKYFRKQIFVA